MYNEIILDWYIYIVHNIYAIIQINDETIGSRSNAICSARIVAKGPTQTDCHVETVAEDV